MIAGAAAGTLIEGPPSRAALAAFAAAAAFPDVDLLFGAHRGATHSLTAAAIAGLLAWIVTRRPRLAAAIAAAYATHTLTDWLSADTEPPIGIMAFWPVSDYYQSSAHVFLPINRRYWLVEAWLGNIRALSRELLILVPLWWIAWWMRRERVRGKG
jgi:membrane-bound metal-dependent hydrolase YbcI (DUF457 family)